MSNSDERLSNIEIASKMQAFLLNQIISSGKAEINGVDIHASLLSLTKFIFEQASTSSYTSAPYRMNDLEINLEEDPRAPINPSSEDTSQFPIHQDNKRPEHVTSQRAFNCLLDKIISPKIQQRSISNSGKSPVSVLDMLQSPSQSPVRVRTSKESGESSSHPRVSKENSISNSDEDLLKALQPLDLWPDLEISIVPSGDQSRESSFFMLDESAQYPNSLTLPASKEDILAHEFISKNSHVKPCDITPRKVTKIFASKIPKRSPIGGLSSGQQTE